MVSDYDTERAKTDRGKCSYCGKPIPKGSIKVRMKHGYRRMSMIQYTSSLCAKCGLERIEIEKRRLDQVTNNVVKGVETFVDHAAMIRKERKALTKWQEDHTCPVCSGPLREPEEIMYKVCNKCK